VSNMSLIQGTRLIDTSFGSQQSQPKARQAQITQ
jgi:hypothetical protein